VSTLAEGERANQGLGVALVLVVACQGGRPAPARDDARSAPLVLADAPPPSVAPCPVPRSAEGAPIDDEVNALLEAAHHALDSGRPGEAWTCADRAADLEPRAVEAHHLRAAALAGLGRHAEAELAFALAVAIDPADPETLRAMADFEVSIRPERPRDALRLGIELARRARAALRAAGKADPKLEAELYVIEAQAENDLGRPDLALALADKALGRRPDDPDALYERADALLDLLRFAEAEVAFRAVLARTPDDPYAHDGLALVV
jgi:Flp pilus assembly protein TadD